MKYLILAISAISLMSCSLLPGGEEIAETDVPSVVKNTFGNTFPQATEVEWETNQNNFEADFEVNNVDYSVVIDTTGNIVRQKHDITLKELPEAVTATIDHEFEDGKAEDAEKVEKDGEIYYQVEIDKFFNDEEVVFTADGQKATNFNYWD